MLHFADDANLLYINKSMKRIKKHINHDLSLISQCLGSNKIILNADKTELVIFSPKRKQITKFLLKKKYYSIFNSHLIYACQVWGQNENFLKKLFSLQNKAIRIINFKQQGFLVYELYYANGILKIKDYIHLINFLFVRDALSNESLEVFSNYFRKFDNFHDHITRHSSRHSLHGTFKYPVLWFFLNQE